MSRNLRVVFIECPYDTWSDPATQQFLLKVVNLKLKGYQRFHPYGILPLDASDFVASHVLVCQEWNGELVPLMGYRSLTLERCKMHRMRFPLLQYMTASNAKQHEAALTEILDRCESKNVSISLESSFTIDPDIRADREVMPVLHDLFTALHVFHQKDYGISEAVTAGAAQLDQALEFAGFEPLSLHGKRLEAITLPMLFDLKVTIRHRSVFPSDLLKHAEKYRSYWENRLVLASQARTKYRRAA